MHIHTYMVYKYTYTPWATLLLANISWKASHATHSFTKISTHLKQIEKCIILKWSGRLPYSETVPWHTQSITVVGMVWHSDCIMGNHLSIILSTRHLWCSNTSCFLCRISQPSPSQHLRNCKFLAVTIVPSNWGQRKVAKVLVSDLFCFQNSAPGWKFIPNNCVGGVRAYQIWRGPIKLNKWELKDETMGKV